MTGGCDEVEHNVDSVIPEARVTLDTRFLCQDAIVLPLEIPDDFGEAGKWSAGAL